MSRVGTPPSVASIAMAEAGAGPAPLSFVIAAVVIAPVVSLTTVPCPTEPGPVNRPGSVRCHAPSCSHVVDASWSGRYCAAALWGGVRPHGRRDTGWKMSLVKRAANKAKSKAPRFTKAVVLARPLPVISDEKPPAGDDYFFKAVLDPTDPHLAQVEYARTPRDGQDVLRDGRSRVSRHPQAHRSRRLQDVAPPPLAASVGEEARGRSDPSRARRGVPARPVDPPGLPAAMRSRSRWCTSWGRRRRAVSPPPLGVLLRARRTTRHPST